MDYIAKNRELWNEWADVNYKSAFYDVETFKVARTPLDPEVIAGLGDLSGKSVLHLQCHFGQDSIRIKLAGAREVVGIDFSEVALAHARQLSAEMGVDVRYVETDLYRLPEVLEGEFDIVFTSYGVLGWLPDLDAWGKVWCHDIGDTYLPRHR